MITPTIRQLGDIFYAHFTAELVMVIGATNSKYRSMVDALIFSAQTTDTFCPLQLKDHVLSHPYEKFSTISIYNIKGLSA